MPARHRHRPGRPSPNARASLSRVSWGLADQAASSLTNFAVGIAVARSLGAAAFGAFTVVWVTYTVVLNLSRGLATDPLAVRFSGAPTASWRSAATRSSSTALLVGLVTGGISMLVGFALRGSVGAGFVALGLVLPALLLQDSWRFAFFAAGQGRKALANDLVWGVALVPLLYLAAQHGSVFGFVLAWGAAGAVAAGYGAVQTGLRPHPGGTQRWLEQHRDLGARYMVENVASSSAAQIRMYGLGAIAGLSEVGAVRGAELLLGPFLAVMMGLSLVAVPEAARVLRRSRRGLPLFCATLGGSQAAIVLVWGMGLLMLPDSAGRHILGPLWESASELILPATLAAVGASICTGAATGLRALGASRRSLRAQLFQSTCFVAGGLTGASAAGAVGSSWGVAAAVAVAAVVWCAQLRAGLREYRSPAVGDCSVAARDPRAPAADAVDRQRMRT